MKIVRKSELSSAYLDNCSIISIKGEDFLKRQESKNDPFAMSQSAIGAVEQSDFLANSLGRQSSSWLKTTNDKNVKPQAPLYVRKSLLQKREDSFLPPNEDTDVNDEDLDQGMKKHVIHSIDTAAMKRLNHMELAVSRVSMLGRASLIQNANESQLQNRGSTFAKKARKDDFDEFDEADCNVDEMEEGCVAVG